MAPPSIKQLSMYLSKPHRNRVSLELTSRETKEIVGEIPWRCHYLPWNGLSCLAVVCYVLKFCSDSENDDMILLDTIRILNGFASEYESIMKHWRVGGPQGTQRFELERKISRTFVNSFMPKVQKFFVVPKLHQFSRKNELLAGFIHFLLQILNSEANHIRNEKEHGLKFYFTFDGDERSLQKELTYLLTFLGDIPFQCIESDEVKNLLTEFEILANEVGRFIYSRVFVSRPVNVRSFYVRICVLFNKVDLLNEKIMNHCIKFSKPSICVTRKASALDSLFIVDSLLEDLKTLINGCADLNDDMKDKTRRLQSVLISSRSFIMDLSVPQDREIEEAKEFLFRIRDLAYEAEYLINSFVVGNVPVRYMSLRLYNVIQNFVLIVTGFEEIKKIIDIEVVRVSEDCTVQISSREATEISKAVIDDIVVGFDYVTIKILDNLTGGSRNLQIISIVGMPGLGKTTLAKKLYDHRSVNNHFDERAWCVASQTYSRRDVLIDLLMSSPSKPDREDLLKNDDESLATMIHKSLKGRRYLMIMDDIWNSDVWNDFSRYFPDDKNGSRIILTTRIRDTAPICSIFHTLPLLSKDQCWELLEKKVFHPEACPSQLLNIGRQIAVKCNGLPLAVVVVAGILANMEKEKIVWEEVEKSLELYTSNCMEILELSYKHLPNHLKLCFLYLGVFPEDTEIPVRKLIRLWIAEGFILKEAEKSLEHVAKKYLMDLINRSLVLISRNRSTGGVKACSVHDLLHDMCLRRAHEENFLNLIKGDQFSTYEKYHRLCVNSATPAYFRPFSQHCRSFFGHLSDPSSCLPQMKLLRIMDLSRNEDMDILYKLTGIDMLVHLRYLVVDRMPEPIVGNLVNLEYLRIDNMRETIFVPLIILKMVKLRHLHVRLLAKFKEDCNSSQTNNLQTLSFVCIYNEKEHKILRCFPHLRKLKCICGPELPDLCFLRELKSLKIAVRDKDKVRRNPTRINFPISIKKLTLYGISLPWERTSIIGRLPNLQVLKLLKDAFDGEEWQTSDREFKGLRFLKLDSLKLKRWIASSEHFPQLIHLVLNKCDQLQSISTELGDIPTLQMIEVHYCSLEANVYAIQIMKEQWENGNEDLKVIITNSKRRGKEQLMLKND